MTSWCNTATKLVTADDRFMDTYSHSQTFVSNPTDIIDVIESPSNVPAEADTAKSASIIQNVTDLFIYKTPKYIRETPFISLQKWEGIVTSVLKRTFHAKLANINAEDDVLAEIPKAEVNDEDLLLLKPGAIFYWNIGYSYTTGTKTRASLIRFKRMPRLTRKQEEAAQARASVLWDKMNWGEGARD